jgi:Cu/Ag efflux pump CusA
MIAKLVEQAIRHRWMVVILVIAVAGLGVYAFQQLPIDAYPDIAGQSVWVITPYPGGDVREPRSCPAPLPGRHSDYHGVDLQR